MRLRRILSVLVLAIILSGLPNPVEADTPLPDTTPPALRLVIMLDNSATMNKSYNSVSESGVGVEKPPRVGTDSGNLRWTAVRRLVDTLNTDRLTTHEVAVLSFDTKDNIFWLTANADDPNNPFINVGEESNIDDYKKFIQNLAAVPDGSRSGDTVEALKKALEKIQAPPATRKAFKPVVLLITDDIPIADYQKQSPFTTGQWPDRAKFEDQINNNFADGYQGSFCQHANGRLVMATFAMGAANWVTSDGRVQRPVENSDESDNYFYDLAVRNGWLKFDQKPFFYPIDPLFKGKQTLTTDLFKATQDFLSEIRCTWGDSTSLPLEGGDPNTRFATFKTPFSELFQQVQFVIENPPGTTVKLVQPDSTSLADNFIHGSYKTPYDAKIPVTDSVFSLTRDEFSPGKWAGTWTVEIDGAGAGQSRVYVTRELNLGEIGWQPVTEFGSDYDPDLNTSIALKITAGNRPVTDSLVIQNANLILVRNNQEVYTVVLRSPDQTNNAAANTFTGAIEGGNPVIDVGQYDLRLRFALNPAMPVFKLLGDATLTLDTTTRITFGRSPTLQPDYPKEGLTWNCENGFQKVGVIIKLQGNNSFNGVEESLSSYTRVELVYQPSSGTPKQSPSRTITPAPTNSPDVSSTPLTPLVVLSWDEQAKEFTGNVDCSKLMSASDQSMQIVAYLPDGKAIHYDRWLFTFSATATPSPTLTPTKFTTPEPIFTPTPPMLDLTTDFNNVLNDTRPFQILLLVIVGAMLIIAGIATAFRRYPRMIPLSFVWIEYPDGKGKRERLLTSPWVRYLFFSQRKTIFEGSDSLFTVEPNPGGSGLRIRSESESKHITVNARRIQSTSSPVPATSRTTIIVVEDKTFVLTNHRA